MLTLPFPDQPIARRNINSHFLSNRGGEVSRISGSRSAGSRSAGSRSTDSRSAGSDSAGSSPGSTAAIFRR